MTVSSKKATDYTVPTINRKDYCTIVGKKPGDITDIPRYGVTAQLDDRFLENSSFLRLKNLTLAYAFPQSLLKKTNFFTSARVYLQGQNLLTWTGFTGLDPEVATNVYRAQYPASRQFTLGIDVSF